MFNRDYCIKGKHADYMRLLVASSEGLTLKRSSRIFDYGYQILFIAPLIGVSYNLRPELDQTKNMDFTIKAIQMIRNKDMLEKTYRMVLLSDRDIKLNSDERVNFVFRPESHEKQKGDELFNSYTRGGIEWLYNNIAKDGGTDDDYLNNIISSIEEFTTEFAIYENIEDKINEEVASYS